MNVRGGRWGLVLLGFFGFSCGGVGGDPYPVISDQVGGGEGFRVLGC